MGGASSPDHCASVEKNGDEITLRAESWDPVLAIGVTIADRYEINVSVEAPKWTFTGDTEDVAVADPAFSEQHDNIHYDVMRSHALEVRFSTSGKGASRRCRGSVASVGRCRKQGNALRVSAGCER